MVRPDDEEPFELHVLRKPQPERDRPTPDHYALEILAYWRHGLLDSVESGRRRRIVVGGYNAARRADLSVEAPLPVSRFTIARLRGREADIVIPRGAVVALRSASQEIIRDVALTQSRAKIAAGTYRLRFGERLAFRLGLLTFVAQFVRSHGRKRTSWDWLLPRFL